MQYLNEILQSLSLLKPRSALSSQSAAKRVTTHYKLVLIPSLSLLAAGMHMLSDPCTSEDAQIHQPHCLHTKNRTFSVMKQVAR
jgi:hypothetical protein